MFRKSCKGIVGLLTLKKLLKIQKKDKISIKSLCLKEKKKRKKKRSWKVNKTFSSKDFFKMFLNEKKQAERRWIQKFGLIEPIEIIKFHKLINKNFSKKYDTFIKTRNKLLLFLNFLHTKGNLNELTNLWKINVNLIKIFVLDVIAAILLYYKDDKEIIGVPTHECQVLMKNILELTNEKLVDAIFYLDGTHELCLGKNDVNKRSWKYRWQAAYSHLFVIDRIFGMVIAINCGNPAKKHDLKVLKESSFGINFSELMNDLFYCLADSAYVSFNKKNLAPMPKKSSIIYKLLEKEFKNEHKHCRSKVEHFFSHFFINQFCRLNKWPFKGKKSLQFLNCCMITAIIFWNQIKIWKIQRNLL